MGRKYGHSSAWERNFLRSSLDKGLGRAEIARALRRSISREIGRSGRDRTACDAAAAGQAARARVCRGEVKRAGWDDAYLTKLIGLI